MTHSYNRFAIDRPPHLSDEYWACITTEADRLSRSLDANDGTQALSDLKCLVESVARIVLDIEGTPADPNTSFDDLVNKAHQLLTGQPGHELANESPFGKMATQASKIARNLAQIRNEYGGGHGRAHQPAVIDEMIAMALDGGLLWTRWALRRTGYFAMGRPTPLIAALVGDQIQIFHSGDLKARLIAANLPTLHERHQRSIGVAVGQRVMQGTFVVRWDGLDPCLESDDLQTWPRSYRLGLAYGLWFDPDDRLTLTPESLQNSLRVLEPVPDCAAELSDWVDRLVRAHPSRGLTGDYSLDLPAAEFIKARIPLRPAEEQPALQKLADMVWQPPF